MTTNTAATDQPGNLPWLPLSPATLLGLFGAVWAFLFTPQPAAAATLLGPWNPQFKGVDVSVSTNIPGGGGDLARLQVVTAMRVDLTDPDIHFMTTPPLSNYVINATEVGGLTVSDFLQTNQLQAAINANFFDSRTYYLPPGTPMDVYGLAVDQGVLVSPPSPGHAAVFTFDVQNHPTVLHTNWPAASLDGVYTAVAGNYPLVVAGKNIIPKAGSLETDPRTVFGLSEDRRYLYLVAIDGRQPDFSEGATDYESAEWLLLLGAYDGINLDGGGSTTLVVQDTTGVPIRLNSSSAVADSGRERTVGSHFGLTAKPLSRFINDVVANPDETTAAITWTTVEPGTSEVEFGTTTSFGTSSGRSEDLTTNHLVNLTGLTPKTGYYFRAVSAAAGEQRVSPTYFFTTPYHAATNQLFAVTNEWKFTSTPQASPDWTGASFDDSSWSGPGPGLLWVSVRSSGPNPDIEPRNTPLLSDPATGYPYVTYYFRTHFALTNLVPGTALSFSGNIDDGAVFYLNGVEVYRLRMPLETTADTLAKGFPCDGDANCLDQFVIENPLLQSLKLGDNVLAVEVHNYNLRSSDITFGLALSVIEPIHSDATLQLQYSGAMLTLTWAEPGYTLQSANSLEGPWTEAASVSPFSTPPSDAHRYYRLRK